MGHIHRALLTATSYHQTFTGTVPFDGSLSTVAMLAIMGGKRPSRPTHPALTNELWTLIQRCWDQDPHSRPEVSEVLKVLPTPFVSRPFLCSSVCEPDSFLLQYEPPSLETVDQSYPCHRQAHPSDRIHCFGP